MIKSCRDALHIGFTSRIPPAANHGNHETLHVTHPNNYVYLAGICDDGFSDVNKKTEKKNNKSGDLPILGKYKSRPANLGRN
jgi:hypothetical protein